MKQQVPSGSGFSESTTGSDVIAGITLAGKTAIITGGHSGIGLETTRVLAGAGAVVVVAARDVHKAHEALVGLNNVEVIALDLAEPGSVDTFCAAFGQKHNRCDLLINNAGIMAAPLLRNSGGHEMQFATNHLGHFRLTGKLWETLVRSKARIVNLSSLGHRFSGIRFDDPDFNTIPYDKWLAYGQSKTANALFSVQLSKLGEPHGVVSLAVHPGRITSTDLSRFMSEEEVASIVQAGRSNPTFVPSFVKTIPQGAATTVWCATSPLFDIEGGVYCADCDISPLVPDDSPQTNGVRRWAVEASAAEKLWEMSEQMVGFSWPGPA